MSDYFKHAIQPSERQEVVKRTIRELSNVNFDTIVVRGISGMSIGVIVAHSMNKEIAIIRKGEFESDHSSSAVVGRVYGRWIIIDDFVASGATLKLIVEAVGNLSAVDGQRYTGYPFRTPGSECVGFFGYNPDWPKQFTEQRWDRFEPLFKTIGIKCLHAGPETEPPPAKIQTRIDVEPTMDWFTVPAKLSDGEIFWQAPMSGKVLDKQQRYATAYGALNK